MKKIVFYSVLVIFFMSQKNLAQGCSDAGFCSIGAMQAQENHQSQLMVGFTFEQTTNKAAVSQQYLQYQHAFNESVSVAANLMSDFEYQLPNLNKFNLMIALPVANRENIIDGLGRSFVANLSYTISF